MMKFAAIASLAFALLIAGCNDIVAQDRPGAFASSRYTTDLTKVCPNPFVIQKDWLMESEHGSFHQLIGGGGTVSQGRHQGPLGSTGIELVILEGGSGLGMGDGEASYMALYAGNSKAGMKPHMSLVGTDNAIIFSNRFPVVGVVTPLEKDPTALIYDPATYPAGFKTRDDLIAFGKSGGGKIYLSTVKRTFGKFLADSGIPANAFIEGYRGDLENFVANNGKWLNQGFVTSEVFDLTHGRSWNKPVAYTLLSDLGYENYPSVPSVAKDRLDELAPCLEKLVPLMQQAQIDYIRDPAEINALMASFNERKFAAGFWRTPRALLDEAVRASVESGVVGNGPTPALGDFDFSRMERLIRILAPGFDERALSNVKPEDIATNRFIDPSITFKP
jgi:hypothetical protein